MEHHNIEILLKLLICINITIMSDADGLPLAHLYYCGQQNVLTIFFDSFISYLYNISCGYEETFAV